MLCTGWQEPGLAVHRHDVVASRLRLLLLGAVLWSPCTQSVAQQIGYRQYLQQDGLSNLTVDCLLQDHQKSLWVCTENGVYRYDGARFERFGPEAGIEHARIFAIAEESERIWLGNTHNLYVGRNGRFHEVLDHGKSMKVGVGAKLAADHGRLLAIAAEKLYSVTTDDDGANWRVEPIFTPDALRISPALAALSALYVDPTGAIWLGCGSHVCQYAAGRMRTWDIDAGTQQVWQSFLLDSLGQLWARSFDHIAVLRRGARQFDYRDVAGSRLTTAQPFVQMVEDHEGRIISRTDVGLLRWSVDASRPPVAELFDSGNGLPSTYMLSLLVDHEGSLWVGTNGNGLLRWQGYGNWESWTTLQGLKSNTIWSIFRDAQQRLFVGTGGGCSMLNEATRRFDACGFRGATAMPELNAMAETPNRRLWLTTMSGDLLRVDPDDSARRIAILPYIRSAHADRNGVLWLLTYRGVYRVRTDGDTPQPARVPIPGAETADFSDAIEDRDGNLWFVSTHGLYSLADNQWSRAAIAGAQASAGYRSLAVDLRNQAWVAGSFHGLLTAKLEHGSVRNWAWVADALVADSAIASIRSDHRGLVWLGTDTGLLLFDGRQWRRFTQTDGLVWNDISETSFFIDTDGSVWVGTAAGLSHITHPERLLESAALDLRIVRAASGTEHLDVGGESNLAWHKNISLDLDFAVADFAKTEGIVFRYRLIGLENEWTETRIPQARYSSLEPGHFRLQVMALNAEHGLRSPLVSLTFTVAPPWWRTVWAELLFAACVGLTLAALWRWRIRRMVALQRSLQRDLREREALLQRATRDALTGLWNRAAILDLMNDEMLKAAQNQTPLAVAMIDVDHFKQVNDTYGHLGGDQVLRSLGTQLGKLVRSTDHIGRYGGEELLLLMPGMPDANPFSTVEKLHRSIATIRIQHEHAIFGVTASIGVAWFTPEGDTAELLIARADAALYAAKNAGRNRIEYSDRTAARPIVAA